MSDEQEQPNADQPEDQAPDQAQGGPDGAPNSDAASDPAPDAESAIDAASGAVDAVGDAAAGAGAGGEVDDAGEAALAAARAAIAAAQGEADGSAAPPAPAAPAANAQADAGVPFNAPEFATTQPLGDAGELNQLSDVDLDVTIELGRTMMTVDDILRLNEGAVVELDKLAGDPVDVFVNGRHVARGEVLVLNDNFCVRVNEIIDPDAEIKSRAAG
ncbi:MAG: flagellar motor switch protein FliN [Planctomycetota bacterium]